MSVEPKDGFDKWWWETGSGIVPLKGHDHEEHAERVAKAAWSAALKDKKALRLQALEELVAQAQELDMGYGSKES